MRLFLWQQPFWFLFVNILFISACTKKTSPIEKNHLELLRIGIVGKCSSFNPTEELSEVCQSLSKLSHPTLTRTIVSDGTIETVPLIAESWTFESPTKLLLQLKTGLTWSNGAPLQCEHFTEKWKRLLRAARHGASPLPPLKGGAEGIRCKTPLIVELDVENSNENIPELLSSPFLSPEYPVRFPEVSPQLGNFQLTMFNAQIGADFARLSGTGLPPPPFSSIQVRYFPSVANAIDALHDGHLDILFHQGGFITEPVPQGWTRVFPSRRSFFVLLNTRKKIFSLRTRRQAFLSVLRPDEASQLLHWRHARRDHLDEIKPARRPASPTKVEAPPIPFPSEQLVLAHPSSLEGKELAENIRAQWAKAFSVDFELSQQTGNPLKESSIEMSALILEVETPAFSSTHIQRILWEQALQKILVPSAEYVPFEASLLPWNSLTTSKDLFENWAINQEFLILPLLTANQVVYLTPEMGNLSLDRFYLWNFEEITGKRSL